MNNKQRITLYLKNQRVLGKQAIQIVNKYTIIIFVINSKSYI